MKFPSLLSVALCLSVVSAAPAMMNSAALAAIAAGKSNIVARSGNYYENHHKSYDRNLEAQSPNFDRYSEIGNTMVMKQELESHYDDDDDDDDRMATAAATAKTKNMSHSRDTTIEGSNMMKEENNHHSSNNYKRGESMSEQEESHSSNNYKVEQGSNHPSYTCHKSQGSNYPNYKRSESNDDERVIAMNHHKSYDKNLEAQSPSFHKYNEMGNTIDMDTDTKQTSGEYYEKATNAQMVARDEQDAFHGYYYDDRTGADATAQMISRSEKDTAAQMMAKEQQGGCHEYYEDDNRVAAAQLNAINQQDQMIAKTGKEYDNDDDRMAEVAAAATKMNMKMESDD